MNFLIAVRMISLSSPGEYLGLICVRYKAFFNGDMVFVGFTVGSGSK